MTFDVIVNPNAHGVASDRALKQTILATAARARARVHETATLHDLDRVAREIAAGQTRGVILAGGDGSHMAGVSALARAFGGALPPVALAPCGRVCTVARNFGVRGTARRFLRRVIASLASGEARVEHKATLRVCDDAGGERVGFIFGAGLVAHFFDVYYASRQQGLTAAARIAARVFVGSLVGSPLAQRVLRSTRCGIDIDGVPHAWHDWSLVLASVVRDLGLHLLATYRAGGSLDRFHVVASGLRPRELGVQMPRVLAGLPLRGEPRVDVLARSLRLGFESPSGAYVLDGDVLRAREVRVEGGPILPLLVP
jgi:diacylglycerol kinase (ATP)